MWLRAQAHPSTVMARPVPAIIAYSLGYATVVPDTGEPQARGPDPRAEAADVLPPTEPCSGLPSKRHASPCSCGQFQPASEETIMRGILLWAVGIPIPVIILLYLFHVI
jgi:hypothetical protein